MCGICGTAGFDDRGLVKKMCDVIEHRGPDNHGIFSDDEVTLGSQRLSIIDIEGGHQPVHNEDESIWITYNGEIYNYRGLRDKLEEQGHKFYTETDTEVIVHLYEEFSEKFVQKLRGMFALALWDARKKKLLLARDGRGIKPLYYANTQKGIIFASEIKSILESGMNRNLNLKAVAQFLSYRFVYGQETMFEGIKCLPPGHLLIYEDGKTRIEEYWDIRIKEPFDKDEENIGKTIKELLKESVEVRLVSDVPLGAFLSGGIDSSSVVGIMSTLIEEPVKTFTVGFESEDEDFKRASMIAEHFNTDHHTLISDFEEMTKKFPEMIWHMDEPVADPAMVPFYFVSELAKKHVTVSLVGEGADELFAGYLHHKLASPYLSLVPEEIRKRIFLRLNTPSPKKDRINLGFKKNKEGLVETLNNSNNDFLNTILLWETKNVLPKFQLMRVDKMTMAHSLEARVPFLDPKLIEYAANIPPNLKMRGFNGKYILKKAMKNELPGEIVRGRKRIFSVPLKGWFENGLNDVAGQYLGDSALAKDKCINQYHVRKILNRKLSKKSDYYQVWSLLMLEMWYRMFMRGEKLWK